MKNVHGSEYDESSSPISMLVDSLFGKEDSVLLANTEGRSLTWKEAFVEAQKFANLIAASGGQAGDRIAYASSDSLDGFLMLLGIWLAGGVASPLNNSLPIDTQRLILDILEPEFLLCDASLPVFGEKGEWRVLDSAGRNGIEVTDKEWAPPVSDECCLVLFTSGTTGRPKGVSSTHKAVALNAARTAAALNLSSNDRILINTPHYYTSAIIHLLTLMSRGGGLVSHQGFLFGETFAELVASHTCTGFGGAPAHFVRIFSSPPSSKPDSLRFMMSSGDHLPQHLAVTARDVFPGTEIFRVYGLSETAGRLCVLPPRFLDEKPESTGLPLPGMSIRIMDDDGVEVETGTLGEVVVSGDMLSDEYLNDAVNTSLLQAEEGFRSGDVGRLDEDGFLYLVGRKDDVFKSGGEKVSCMLIQQEVMRTEMCSDAAVIPVEDAMLGKVPHVLYSLECGQTFDKRAMMKALKRTLPATHVPRFFTQVEYIPRTGSGKARKEALLNLLGAEV